MKNLKVENERLRKLLQNIVAGEGCAFFLSRKFESGKKCGEENGRGRDCSICAAKEYLGIK